MRRTVVVTIALLVIGAAGPASATPEDVANRVSRDVMSPFCPGVTLHDCPSGAARDLVAEIEQWARDGMSYDEIFERLEAEYGPTVRAAPPTRGSGLLAWLLPGLAVVAGGAAAILVARRWSRGAGAAADTPQLSAEERRALEAELRAYREAR